MVRARSKLRTIIGRVKDTTAIAKAFVTSKRVFYQAQRAVVQATSFSDRHTPPPQSKLLEVISAGKISRPATAAVVRSLIDRLHCTRDAYVALKCLYTIHTVLQNGSLDAKRELLSYGGRNSMIMATFRDKTDSDAWELSSWVRWYASVIEQQLKASLVPSFQLWANGDHATRKRLPGSEVSPLATSDLISGLGVLVVLLELLSEAPPSLQQTSLVYEVVRLVSYDYGSTQKNILMLMEEVEDRVSDLGCEEMGMVANMLSRVESCKEKLGLLFLNRNRHDAYWEKMGELSIKYGLAIRDKTERMSLVVHGT